jgi:hypothetical protein
MFLHQGAVYRRALTPEQKEHKRQYVLEQQQESDKIPSLKEVLKEHKTDLDENAEEYPYLFDEDFDDNDVVDHLIEKGVFDPDETTNAEVDALVEKHRDDVIQEMATFKARDWLEKEMEERYYDAEYRIRNELDEQSCWRHVVLPLNIDPATHTNLGIYWAYEEDAAEAHWGGKGQKVIYHGNIDLEYVDKAGTLYANVAISTGEEEKEVRFFKGAPIWIWSVTLQDGTVVDIDDWRTT